MLLISIIIAFTMTLVFMVMLRKFARRIELVDEPGGRKFHDGAVPLVGGAAMYGGLLSGLLLLPGDVMTTANLLLAAGLLVAVGVLDDKHTLPWSLRIGVQILAVLIMVYGGGLMLYDIGDPFGFGTIHLGVAALFITLLVCLTVINAFNLVDGADGLAGSLALITLTAVLIVGGIQASAMQIEMVAVAALLGFLLFNFPMAANRRMLSFMGDSGSTLLGFLILWTTISVSQGADRVASPVVCLWFASIPIYDLLTCFALRIRKGRSPVSAGRDHFHHILERGGMSSRHVLGVLAGLQFLYAGLAVAAHFIGVTDVVMFSVWSVLGITQQRVIKRYAALYRARVWRRRLSAQTKGIPRLQTF